jgi:hypothetical protein
LVEATIEQLCEIVCSSVEARASVLSRSDIG